MANANGVGPHNVEKWRESFEGIVDRLEDAEGEDFDEKTDWINFDIWSMYGKFVCPRYLKVYFSNVHFAILEE